MVDTLMEICAWLCLLYGLNGLIKILYGLANLVSEKFMINSNKTEEERN